MRVKSPEYLFLFYALFVLFLLAGCGEEPVKRAPRPAAKTIKAVKPEVAETSIKKEPIEEPFIYSPIGQRDPFASLLVKEQVSRETNIPKTPLEKFDLGQFRIQATLIGKGVPRAMVSAPDGKNYILKPGLKIGKNNGVIKSITETAVIVEETSFDLAGNITRGLQSITIPQNEKF